jgi:hypothetical protein
MPGFQLKVQSMKTLGKKDKLKHFKTQEDIS